MLRSSARNPVHVGSGTVAQRVETLMDRNPVHVGSGPGLVEYLTSMLETRLTWEAASRDIAEPTCTTRNPAHVGGGPG